MIVGVKSLWNTEGAGGQLSGKSRCQTYSQSSRRRAGVRTDLSHTEILRLLRFSVGGVMSLRDSTQFQGMFSVCVGKGLVPCK